MRPRIGLAAGLAASGLAGLALAGALPTIELDAGGPVLLESLAGFGPGFDPAMDPGQVIVRDSGQGVPTEAELSPCVDAPAGRVFVEGASEALVADIGGVEVQADGAARLVLDSASCCPEPATGLGAGTSCLAPNRFLVRDDASATVRGDYLEGKADDTATVVIDQDPDALAPTLYTGTGRSSTELRSGGFAGALVLELLASLTATGGRIDGTSLAMHQHAHLVVDGAAWTGEQASIRLLDDAVLELLSGPACGGEPATTEVEDTAFVFVAGSGFTIDGAPVPPGPIAATSGVIEGTLPDGEAVCLPFARAEGATIAFPAPGNPAGAAAALAALGVVGRRRRRGRRCFSPTRRRPRRPPPRPAAAAPGSSSPRRPEPAPGCRRARARCRTRSGVPGRCPRWGAGW